jgi:PAS domain S-box-containing protein
MADNKLSSDTAGGADAPTPVQAAATGFRRLADALPEFVWTARSDGTLTWLSARWAQATGGVPWQVGRAQGWTEMVHPDDLTTVRRLWRDAVSAAQPFEAQMRMRPAAHAGYRWFAARALPEFDSQHQVTGWLGINSDITEQKNAERKAQQAAGQLQQIFAHAPLIVLVADANGTYTMGMGKDLGTIGLTAENIVGQNILARTAVHSELNQKIKRVLAGEDMRWEDYNYDRWWEIHGTPVWEGENKQRPAGLVSICFDITARKEVERLAISEQIARSAAELKAQFLATMSHEIRTPLGGILGVAEILLETPLMPEARALVAMLRDSGQNLLAVVDEILDYSKLEAGRMLLHVAPLSLRVFLHAQLEALTDAARQKGLRLTLEVDPSVPEHVCADAAQLGVILRHYLANGIKFTQAGHVTLRCALGSALADMGPASASEAVPLLFSVEDSGIGIDPSLEATLFQPFVQADVSHSRSHGGTGLGLSICRGLAQLMGGRVGYRSVVGQGTTVWLGVRLAPAEAPASAATKRSAPQPAPVRRTGRILVAEDDRVNQAVLAAQLRSLGHAVVMVADGHAVLDALAQDTFDVVLMDCHMPVLDGWEAAMQIRAMPQVPGSRRIPLIALTASSSAEDLQRCYAAGIDNCLTKPCSAAQLDKVLTPWLAP